MNNGAFIIARQFFESDLWLKKPSSWKVIWIYILGKVNHKNNGKFERGESHFNFTLERKLIGNDITEDQIKKAISWFRDSSMIRTTRSTRGTIVKVLNYNKFQELSNYSSTSRSTSKAREKHADKQECKNVKNKHIRDNDDFERIWKKYPAKSTKGRECRNGKKASLKVFNASVKTDDDLTKINMALDNYLSYKKVKDGYISNASTFFNNWEEYVPDKLPVNGLQFAKVDPMLLIDDGDI